MKIPQCNELKTCPATLCSQIDEEWVTHLPSARLPNLAEIERACAFVEIAVAQVLHNTRRLYIAFQTVNACVLFLPSMSLRHVAHASATCKYS